MYATSQNSRRQFLATTGGAALLALTATGGVRTASAAPIQLPTAEAGETQASMLASLDPKQQVVGYLKQWMFDPNNSKHSLLSKNSFESTSRYNYNLKNIQVKRFLQYESQIWGSINLGWTDDAKPATAKKVARWFFTRKVNNGTPLTYGEPLGLGYGISPSFIHYKKRRVGINLDWSHVPVLEWQLLGGPIGSRVSSGEWIAIYNKRAGDCRIHFDRTVGGDLGWPSSETWTDQLGDVLTKAVKKYWKEAAIALLTM